MCSDFLFLKKCSLDDLILEISVRIWKPLYYERSEHFPVSKLHFFKTTLTNKELERNVIWFGRNKVNERFLDISKLKPFQWEHIILKICSVNIWYSIILRIWKMFNFSFLLIHTYTIKGKKERRKNSKLKRFFMADVKMNIS